MNHHPPRPQPTPTAPWVWVLAAGVAVAGLVAAVLIVVTGTSSDELAEPSMSTAAPTTAAPTSATSSEAASPTEAEVTKGVVKILTAINEKNGSDVPDSTIKALAECFAQKMVDQVSDETLQNWADGSATSAPEDVDTMSDISDACFKENAP